MLALRLLLAVAFVVLSFLFSLPGAVAQHMFIGWIADWIRDSTGLELPRLETVLMPGSFLMPLLAAGAALYLYHKAYLPIVISQFKRAQPVQPVPEGGRRVDWLSYVACFVLAIFVVSVGYAGYVDKFRPAIPGPTKYLDLRQLPNPALRERAFAVATKLRDLSKEYAARQTEINSQYEKEKAAFEKRSSEYETEKAEYDRARVAACPGLGLGATGLTLGTGCTLPAGPPSPMGDAPSYPVVSVDPVWAAKAENAEEEAAAVWEEMPHRSGTYARIFNVPQNYNPDTPSLSEWASALEDHANGLH